jgi:hypothetical protein
MNIAILLIVLVGVVVLSSSSTFSVVMMSGGIVGDVGGDATASDQLIGVTSDEKNENIPSLTEFTPDGCVVFADNSDGTGGLENNTFCLDNGHTSFQINNFKTRGFNDKISSIGVGRGVGMTVYEHANFKGASHTIEGPMFEDIADTWRNDKASSMKMYVL